MCSHCRIKRKGRRAAMWAVMRHRHKNGRPFTIADIALATESKPGPVMGFVRLLCLAGVAEVSAVRVMGQAGGHNSYRLARDLGARCPVRRAKGLWDANSREYLESAEARPYARKAEGPKADEKPKTTTTIIRGRL